MNLEKLENKQNSYNSHGGKRDGSGRKAKAKMYIDLSISERRKIFYGMVTEAEFLEIVKNYIQSAKKNPNYAEFLINQMIGKPMQAIEMTGKNGKDLIPTSKAVEILKLFTSSNE